MLESRRRTSVLGIIAILTGVAAAVLSRFHLIDLPTVEIGPVHAAAPLVIGVAGLLVGFVSFIAAAASPRTRTGAPIMAMVICAAAVGFIVYSSGGNPLASPAAPKLPVTLPPQIAAPSSPATQPTAPQPARPRTIFDPDFPSSAPPPDSSTESAPPPHVSPPPSSTTDAQASIREARSRLQSARDAVIGRLQSTDAYRTAKADADAAEADLKKARINYAAGSPELIAASQRAMDAKGKVQKLIDDAMAHDPDATAARRDLQSLQPTDKR